MMKRGAPSFEFDQDIADEILKLMVENESKSIKTVLSMKDYFPKYDTLQKWLNSTPPFAEQYARAIIERHQALAESVIEIADDNELKPDDKRVRVDARKWIVSKILPKQYGDKISAELSGPNGEPIKSEISVVEYVIVDREKNSDSEK